jgi:hypothetical protein
LEGVSNRDEKLLEGFLFSLDEDFDLSVREISNVARDRKPPRDSLRCEAKPDPLHHSVERRVKPLFH